MKCTGTRLAKLAALSGLLLLSIGLVTWPAPTWWARGLPAHWDPPLHAWKLMWNAEGLVRWGRLLPDAHAAMFYPHAYTLYFDDLFWLPSVMAAALRLVTSNPAIVYHTVMWAFWVFSGLGAWCLFRALGAGARAATWGAVAFCCMPYRASYYLEFNMQLCFGVPWALYFLLRYAQDRRPLHLAALGLMLLAQAITALYYAVILAVVFPMMLLPYLRVVPTGVRDRRAVLAGLMTTAAVALVGLVFLSPYWILKSTEHLERRPQEIQGHSAEPLNWVWRNRGVAHQLGFRAPRATEMLIAPGAAIFALGAAGVIMARHRRRDESSTDDRAAGPTPGMSSCPEQWITAAVLVWLLIDLWASRQTSAPTGWLNARSWLTLSLVFGTAIWIAVEGWYNERARPYLALTGAAVFAWVLSFGFMLGLGDWESPNPLFAWLYEHLFLLRSVRVVSRFSLVPLLALIAYGVRGVEALQLDRRAWPWLWAGCVAVTIWDGGRGVVVRYRPWHDRPEARAFVREAERDGRPRTLWVIPFGERYHDSRYMLEFRSRHVWLFNGWSGFRPTFGVNIARRFATGQAKDALALLAGVHPDPYVAVDYATLKAENWIESFAPAIAEMDSQAFPVSLGGSSFRFWKLPRPTHTEDGLPMSGESIAPYAAIARSDWVSARPWLVFEARREGTSPGADRPMLYLLAGGSVLAAYPLEADEWQCYACRVPSQYLRPAGNVFTWLVRPAVPWRLRNDDFRATPPPDARTPDESHVADLIRCGVHVDANGAWSEAPVGARGAARVRFAGGIELRDVELQAASCVTPGDTITLVTWWTCPASAWSPDLAVFAHIVHPKTRRYHAGGSLFLSSASVSHQPYPHVFRQIVTINVPADFEPGTYDLVIGLHSTETGRRVAVRSSVWPHHKRAVRLPWRIELARVKRETTA